MMTSDEFNFDEWVKLAEQDIDVFEKKRSEYLSEFISQVPEKYHERMIRTQWVIDMERKLSRSSMASCLKIYSQMWDSFCGEGGLSDEINNLLHCLNSPATCSISLSKSEDVFIKDNVVDLL